MTDDVRHAPPLIDKLRAHGKASDSIAWNGQARQLLLWAADAIEAANVALSETGTHSTRVEVMGHPDQPVSARCILSGCQDFSAASPDRDDLVNRLWGYEEYCREREMLDMARAFSEAALALERTDERSDK